MPLQTVSSLKCPECDAVFSEEDVTFTRIYECGECGNKFTQEDAGNNRCDSCGKLAARIDSKAGTGGRYKKSEDVPICNDCTAVELEEVEATQCPFCEVLADDEDKLAEHLQEDHAGEIIEDWLADQTTTHPNEFELLNMLTSLTHYIYQLESENPEQILNPIHLWPAKGETQEDLDARNRTLRDDAIALLERSGRPFHAKIK